MSARGNADNYLDAVSIDHPALAKIGQTPLNYFLASEKNWGPYGVRASPSGFGLEQLNVINPTRVNPRLLGRMKWNGS